VKRTKPTLQGWGPILHIFPSISFGRRLRGSVFCGRKNPGLSIFFENFSAWANILSLTKRYSVASGGVGDCGNESTLRV